MHITDVRIRLVEPTVGNDRLLAFATVIFDNVFAVHDFRVVNKEAGPFVAMPDRSVMAPCQICSFQMPIRAKFCSNCGNRLSPPGDNTKAWVDIAHPIDAEFRKHLSAVVLERFNYEVDLFNKEKTVEK